MYVQNNGGPVAGGLNEGWSRVVFRLTVDLTPDTSSLPDGSVCLMALSASQSAVHLNGIDSVIKKGDTKFHSRKMCKQ